MGRREREIGQLTLAFFIFRKENLMHLSGQTPLFRAKNLEKYLGIESIYLKLEGSNPTGHKNDRIAEALIKHAIAKNYSHLLIYGSSQYIKSVLYFAHKFNLKCIIVKKGKKSSVAVDYMGEDVQITYMPSLDPNQEQSWLENLAIQHHYYLLSEWENKPFIRSLALQEMTEEALTKVTHATHIWAQSNGGYTIKSIYHELIRTWIKGNLGALPQLYCGVSDATKIDSEFVNISNTHVIALDSSRLQQAAKLLKKLENITVSTREAYALAAFLSSESKTNGQHIIFLNDGKSDISINDITRTEIDFDALVASTRKLLEPYHDSVEETSDAIQKAIKCGFIFTATRNDELHGICIIVNMGFETFIPTYHLAYIGVKQGNGGRGVATELINAAVDKTQGNLSLHVDIPNKRAKKLYEKMGFVHCYDRMLYKG